MHFVRCCGSTILLQSIVIVVKLLVHGHCSESGLHSLPSRSSRCPRCSVPKKDQRCRTKSMCMMELPCTFFSKLISAPACLFGTLEYVIRKKKWKKESSRHLNFLFNLEACWTAKDPTIETLNFEFKVFYCLDL